MPHAWDVVRRLVSFQLQGVIRLDGQMQAQSDEGTAQQGPSLHHAPSMSTVMQRHACTFTWAPQNHPDVHEYHEYQAWLASRLEAAHEWLSRSVWKP